MSDAAPLPTAVPDDDTALDVLQRGELEVHGRLVDASNATLFATVSMDGVTARCVYKPVSGERPLWDFPGRTLARREVATYVLSAATGWDVVPPTVLRDGPFGPGSVQWWIDGEPDGPGPRRADPQAAVEPPAIAEPGAGLVDVLPPQDVPPGWLHVVEADGWDGSRVALVHADDPSLRHMCVLDAVTNNADRKGGHILRDPSGAVFGVDHGLTFNVEDKLRTVLWGWAGRRLTADTVEVLTALARDLSGDSGLRQALLTLLTRAEVDRTAARARALLSAGRHPRPGVGRPSIPWPAF